MVLRSLLDNRHRGLQIASDVIYSMELRLTLANPLAKSHISSKFISDSVVSIGIYYECGICKGDCYQEGNKAPAFTYSSGETTAGLIAEE